MPISYDDLAKAVRAGVITQEQADVLTAQQTIPDLSCQNIGENDTVKDQIRTSEILDHQPNAAVSLSSSSTGGAGELVKKDPSQAELFLQDEPFVLVNNFSELFVGLGMLLLFWGSFVALADLREGWSAYLALCAIGCWLMAEFCVFKAKLLLPSLLSSLACAGFIAAFVVNGVSNSGSLDWVGIFKSDIGQLSVISALGMAIWRFRLPFLVFPMLLLGVLLSVSLAKIYLNLSTLPVMMFCGLALLFCAVWLDLHDPNRSKRTSQFAFWTYVIASPLTVHPLFVTLIRNMSDASSFGTIAIVIVIVAVLITLFGLLMDRRSPVVSTLVYVAFAIGYGVRSATGATPTVVFAAVLSIIGLYVICLGISWGRVRRFVMKLLPSHGVFSYLPRVRDLT